MAISRHFTVISNHPKLVKPVGSLARLRACPTPGHAFLLTNLILSRFGIFDEMSSADRVEKPEKRGSAATVRVSALPSHQAH
jgi:hypothetical protein